MLRFRKVNIFKFNCLDYLLHLLVIIYDEKEIILNIF